MEGIIIVGFGGHAKSIADSIERGNEYRIVGYTNVNNCNSKYDYLGTDDNLNKIFEHGVKNAVIGVGYLGKGTVRQDLYKKLKKIGFNLPIIIDPSAILSESVQIEEGSFIGKNVIINTESIIGKMTIINTNAVIEHECIIGDYAHIAVSATLCGRVKVGEGSLVGANATVIQCKEIGDYQIVPAGYVVRR